MLPLSAAAKESGNSCADPQVIKEWAQLSKKHIGSDEWQRFHAIWLGLFEKVRQGSLEQTRANRLFEEERDNMMQHEKRREQIRINPFG